MKQKKPREFPCAVCNKTIDMGMCLSGVKIDGRAELTHVYCADEYSNRKMEVYKVSVDDSGSYYEESLDAVVDMIQNSDLDCEYKIKKTLITKGEYESLEEFRGF